MRKLVVALALLMFLPPSTTTVQTNPVGEIVFYRDAHVKAAASYRHRKIRCFGKRPTYTGDASNNRKTGTDGNDIMHMRGGDDFALADSGDDRLCGGRGDDNLLGNNGADRVNGGKGHDICDGELLLNCEEEL